MILLEAISMYVSFFLFAGSFKILITAISSVDRGKKKFHAEVNKKGKKK